jgi:hypothetical protein
MKAISFVQPTERLSHVSIESKLHGKRGWHAVSFGRRRGNDGPFESGNVLILGTTNTTI